MRLRREYLYRKAQEDRLRTIEEKKQKLKGALDGKIACALDSILHDTLSTLEGDFNQIFV